ncbi:MAG: thrombospondin type 3 repeat-containing protein [Bacteroidetes bacterium]|nr:thrombospondin type 3 repeat-containing protein [Bacteroidota bacterium]
MPETPLNIFYAYNIDRDYKYETRLGTSSEFPHNAMVVPVSYGIKLKLTSRCDANLGFSYHFTFTDYLDYVKSKANDKYFFTYASCTWHIFKKVKTEEDKNPTVNFASIDKSDADGDGIPDLDDLCPYNPKGVLVDSKGCPIDSDNDGVPDYSDKEPHSKSGAQVNTDGIELTKEKLAELKKENITVASHSDAFSDQFNKKPSAEFLKEIAAMEIEARKNPANTSANKPIPSNLKISDWNKDGFISPEEITKTIEAFFDGSIDFSAEQIHKIIDFFFEQ